MTEYKHFFLINNSSNVFFSHKITRDKLLTSYFYKTKEFIIVICIPHRTFSVRLHIKIGKN